MTSQQTDWPEWVLARYLTVAGATVDIRDVHSDGILTADCTGERCPWRKRVSIHAFYTDTLEQRAEKVEECLPQMQRAAQAHAETCRAMPRLA